MLRPKLPERSTVLVLAGSAKAAWPFSKVAEKDSWTSPIGGVLRVKLRGSWTAWAWRGCREVREVIQDQPQPQVMAVTVAMSGEGRHSAGQVGTGATRTGTGESKGGRGERTALQGSGTIEIDKQAEAMGVRGGGGREGVGMGLESGGVSGVGPYNARHNLVRRHDSLRLLAVEEEVER